MTHQIISTVTVTVSGKKSTDTRFFLSLRAAFVSFSSNTNTIAADCLLENEWRFMFDGNNRRPPVTCCSGR